MRKRVLLLIAALALIAAGVSAVIVVTRTGTASGGQQTWTPVVTPLPEGEPTGELDAVACAAVGACMLMGNYNENSGGNAPLVETGWQAHWALAAAPRVTSSIEDLPEVRALSCPSPGYCAAAVDTQDSEGGGTSGGVIATFAHGTDRKSVV